MRPGARQSQRGQAALEFVLVFMFIIAVTALLFQALQFELDVFNKSFLARYKLLHEAHKDQDKTEGHEISQVIQGKNLSDITPYKVPFQDADLTMHYGPRTLYGRGGTKYWDPLPLHDTAAFWAILNADHLEDTSGHISQVVGYVSSVTDLVKSVNY
jgi:hypothetical protein